MKIKKNRRRQAKKGKWKLTISFLAICMLLVTSYFLNFPGKLRNQFDNQKMPINAKIKAYQPKVSTAIAKYNLPDKYLELISAMMMQESKGIGSDPMQVSEAKCGKIGCIKDPEISIDEGVKQIKIIIDYAKQNDIDPTYELIAQTYNYGRGYIDFLVKNGYLIRTSENSRQFSREMCGRSGTSIQTAVNLDVFACYGDYLYYEHVKRYL
jgi:hypothetical protein